MPFGSEADDPLAFFLRARCKAREVSRFRLGFRASISGDLGNPGLADYKPPAPDLPNPHARGIAEWACVRRACTAGRVEPWRFQGSGNGERVHDWLAA